MKHYQVLKIQSSNIYKFGFLRLQLTKLQNSKMHIRIPKANFKSQKITTSKTKIFTFQVSTSKSTKKGAEYTQKSTKEPTFQSKSSSSQLHLLNKKL